MEKKGRLLNNFFYFLTIFLCVGFVYLFLRIEGLYETIDFSEAEKSSLFDKLALDSEKEIEEKGDYKEEIEEIVSQAISSISAQKNISVPNYTGSSEKKISYIPITGPITSTSTSWVDVAGSDVYIDLNSDYGKNASVSWEVFLKVAHGNGTAYARLFDVTHGIAVSGSELSVSDMATSTQLSSGNLGFWAGRNLYRVQIKSLNSFEITFASGRIKIVY